MHTALACRAHCSEGSSPYYCGAAPCSRHQQVVQWPNPGLEAGNILKQWASL